VDKRDALRSLRLEREPEPPARRMRLPWWSALAAGVTLCATAAGLLLFWALSPGPAVVHVIAVKAENGSSPAAILNASGYVVPKVQATVAAQTTGMITEVLVQEGEHVKAGQVLARLDDNAARALSASATSQLEADRALILNYQAQLDRDRQNLVRIRALSEQGAISRVELDAAIAAARQSDAMLAHARSQVHVDEHQRELDETLADYSIIRAPFDGVVTERYAHPGEMISPQAVGGFTQTGICTLVDMRSLEINVDVNEAYIKRVFSGQPVRAVLDAYPDWQIPAHVINIVPTANQQKGTVKVRIAFDKIDARVLPQMGIQVWFETKPSPEAPAAPVFLVPNSTISRAGAIAQVYRVENRHVRAVPVRLGARRAASILVLDGLSEGDRIVVSASRPLKDGEYVREE
jgi:HlyD family secretion protein